LIASPIPLLGPKILLVHHVAWLRYRSTSWLRRASGGNCLLADKHMLRTHTQAQSELNQREFLSRDRLRSLLGLLSLTPRAVTHLGPRTARVTLRGERQNEEEGEEGPRTARVILRFLSLSPPSSSFCLSPSSFPSVFLFPFFDLFFIPPSTLPSPWPFSPPKSLQPIPFLF